jgi:hypothetical protein
LDNAHAARDHDGQHRSNRNVLMKRRRRTAIDTRAAAKDQRLRLAPAFGEAREIEEFIEPQTPLRLWLCR